MADETATATTTTTATPNTVATTTTSSPKPGWKTSEFYFKIGAILLSSLFATGVIPTSGPIAMIAMIAATMLGAIGYTVSRTLVKNAAVPILFVLLLVAPQPACGASAREKTITATFVATHTAAVELDDYADRHEGDIIKDATSPDDSRARLLAFRAKVDKAEKGIDGVYRLIELAALLKDEQSLSTLVQAALVLSSELKDLGVIQ